MRPLLDNIFEFNRRLYYNNPVWEKVRINSICRFGLRFVANNILPVIYKCTQKTKSKTAVPVIVSLTSFPVRIGKLWIVIESILRQTAAVEKVVLWLSKEQFPNGIEDLPQELKEQQDRGLEIRFVDGDIRSHKKYYYAFHEFPDKYILTIDDDLLFPSTFIKDVYECALRHPNSVIGNFGSKIKWNKDLGYIEKLYVKINKEETGKDLFFGSGGGTLFPPNRLLDYMDDISVIWQLCPTADDIYLNSLCRIAGLEVTFREIIPLLSIENKNDEKLTDQNGNLFSPQSRNADQLRSLIMHFKKRYDINPFANQ